MVYTTHYISNIMARTVDDVIRSARPLSGAIPDHYSSRVLDARVQKCFIFYFFFFNFFLAKGRWLVAAAAAGDTSLRSVVSRMMKMTKPFRVS